MAKYLETRQMAKLYQAGHTMQQIADAYRITKQAVSQRRALAGIKRRLKIHKIDKPTLERIYTIERLSVEQIAEHFGTHRQMIRKALARHKIPTRPPLKPGGPIVDQLRALRIGASVESRIKVKIRIRLFIVPPSAPKLKFGFTVAEKTRTSSPESEYPNQETIILFEKRLSFTKA